MELRLGSWTIHLTMKLACVFQPALGPNVRYSLLVGQGQLHSAQRSLLVWYSLLVGQGRIAQRIHYILPEASLISANCCKLLPPKSGHVRQL